MSVAEELYPGAEIVCDPYSRWFDDVSGVEMCCNSSGTAATPCTVAVCEPYTEYCDGDNIEWACKTDGSGWYQSGTCAECVEGASQGYVACEDGTSYYAYECVGGRWVATNGYCQAVQECYDEGAEATLPCPDGSSITEKVCQDGIWMYTGNGCPADGAEDKTNLIILLVLAIVGVNAIYLGLRGSR